MSKIIEKQKAALQIYEDYKKMTLEEREQVKREIAALPHVSELFRIIDDLLKENK